MTDGFIPTHGGYQHLLSYQKAEIVYDATVQFCARFLNKRDRTVDQMVQAARSGKQNIVEGSMASGTSKEMELKLTNVARASLEELLTDYRDFLRTHDAPEWDKNSKEALFVRRLSAGKIAVTGGRGGGGRGNGTNGTNGTHGTNEKRGDRALDLSHSSHKSHLSHSSPPKITFAAFRSFFETRPPEVLANIAICLIHQTNYLLDQQIRQLEQAFIKEGGLRERMTRARLDQREKDRGGRRG